MPPDILARLDSRIQEVSASYHRLVLLVGPPRSGKTTALQALQAARGWLLVNVNLALSQRLLDWTRKQRAVRVAGLLSDLADETPGEVLLLDNLELLFGRELELAPLRLLQGLSRNRTVVASWCGQVVGEQLTYAEPGHPEYRREPLEGLCIETTPSQGLTQRSTDQQQESA